MKEKNSIGESVTERPVGRAYSVEPLSVGKVEVLSRKEINFLFSSVR